MKQLWKMLILLVVLSLMVPSAAFAAPNADTVVNFSILHTNDFHGNLDPSTISGYSNTYYGAARVATVVNGIRTAKGADNVLLFDAGDIMQGSLLSNIKKGEPAIGYYQALGYNGATFGNHEFDWGLATLQDRISQASTNPPGFPPGVDGSLFTQKKAFPFISSNIVLKGAATDCNTITTWNPPAWAAPYMVYTVGTAPNQVKVGVMGVTTQEVPNITLAGNTDGLCFRDPADAIANYYDTVKAAGAQYLMVLSHLGMEDGGYGYGFAVYGDKTLAKKLNDAGKPVNAIIGGHSHTNVTLPAPVVGNTIITQAYYAGRQVGELDIQYNLTTHALVSQAWVKNELVKSPATPIVPPPPTAETPDANIQALINAYKDPAYTALVDTPVGYTKISLVRNYYGDNLMSDFINDAIYGQLNGDANPNNDVDMVFNNAGGLRADLNCATAPATPCLLKYGDMFSVLPFGNATAVGSMTGAQILDVLNQSATLTKGALQVAGVHFKFYRYGVESIPTSVGNAWAWGAYDVCVVNKTTPANCDPLDMTKTYKVGTNEFLAPAGGDSFSGFKYMSSISYYGDMLEIVNTYVKAHFGTELTAYDATLDGRVTREGDNVYHAGVDPVIPVTILHHNDSHGNLTKGAYVGYTQLATLINSERLLNPDRTILVTVGDNIQGDAMEYYFRTAPTGYASDGTALAPALRINPIIAAMNSMNYDAYVLGNHEFNFGKDIFVSTFKQAVMPLLGANVTDDGRYGLAQVNVQPYVIKSLPGPSGNIDIALLGLTNHRVPNYELPSNIPGLSFSNPIDKAAALVPGLKAANDAVVALTHIGFTTDPKSVEVDNNVDTYLAAQVGGIDAIIGSHSHTNPATGFGDYKYLPAMLAGPTGQPVIINQAYRYNNTLGEVILGFKVDGSGYTEVARAGKFLSVPMTTTEDAATKAIIDPYTTVLNTYRAKPVGQTTTPIDALKAFTQETNAANLQADAAVYELARHGISVNFHISGAMTNKKVADAATPASPTSLVIDDMFSLMPYENSLVVLSMNGPQLKTVLERGYRNYYFYKYVTGYGGYSYYTTCMLDINSGGQIVYNNKLPNGDNVVSLTVKGQKIDFTNYSKFYEVSTVNYLAAGSCNFNDGGVTLWPLDQITHDTQYYVRDAVIDFIRAAGVVSPAIEGRLQFLFFRYLPEMFNQAHP